MQVGKCKKGKGDFVISTKHLAFVLIEPKGQNIYKKEARTYKAFGKTNEDLTLECWELGPRSG